MKAFRFRLDQALRWRATQVDIEKAAAASAASRLAGIREEAESLRQSLTGSALELASGATGESLKSWSAWRDRTRRRIVELEGKEQEARKALDDQMQRLLEANRKQRLLEKLREGEQARWQADFGRELEAFASEVFLGRLQSKSGRARSSGG